MDQKIPDFHGESGFRSPNDLDSGEYDVYTFHEKHNSWSGEDRAFERKRLRELGSDLGLPQDMYEHRISPVGERGNHLHDMTERFPRRPPRYEDAWDLPEDPYIFHDSKKFKSGSISLDKELPEYSYNNIEQEQRAYPRSRRDFPPPETSRKGFEIGGFGHKQIPDQPVCLYPSQRERNDHMKSLYDELPMGSRLLPETSHDRKRFTPEVDPPSLREWKWEGTIAKGGKPICRARCFPVGKVMDFML